MNKTKRSTRSEGLYPGCQYLSKSHLQLIKLSDQENCSENYSQIDAIQRFFRSLDLNNDNALQYNRAKYRDPLDQSCTVS